MTYKLRAIGHIHECFAGTSSTDVWVKRDLELPFVPFPGLTVWDGEDLEVNIPPDAPVYFNPNTGNFQAYVFEDKERYHNRGDARPMEEIVAEYLAVGWEIRPRSEPVAY